MARQWFQNSMTPAIKNWLDLSGASTSGDYKNISDGGAIYTEVTGTALMSSNYCKIEMNYALTLESSFNYTNKIYILMAGHYIDNGEIIQFRTMAAVTKYNTVAVDYGYSTEIIVDTMGLPMQDLTVYLMNNCGSSIEVRSCEIKHSYDNNEEQTQAQILDFYQGGKLLEVDVREANKLKITYETGTIEFDWADDTTNRVVTLSNSAQEILLKY